MIKRSLYLFFFLFMSSLGFSGDTELFIEKAIQWINPHVSQERAERYAAAIVKAADRFDVEPLTLVAIAHQESSFRENLPLGRAGEVGMLQIRKAWLSNKKFRRVFRKFSQKDLKNPETAFMAAAWILSDLKKSTRATKLPYWTYYNARQFRNRFKYYLRVGRHLSRIETKRAGYERILLATNTKKVEPSVPVAQEEANPARELLAQINWHRKAIEVLKSKNERTPEVILPINLLLKKGIVSLFLPHES